MKYTQENIDWQKLAEENLKFSIKHHIDNVIETFDWYGKDYTIKVYDTPIEGHKVIDEFPSTLVWPGTGLHSNPLHIGSGEYSDEGYLDYRGQYVKVKTAAGKRYWAVQSDTDTYGYIVRPDTPRGL